MGMFFQKLKAASKNLIRYNHHLRALVTLGMVNYRFPSVIGIDPSSACNLRCTMCPAHQKTGAAGIMTLDLFNRIIDESLCYGKRWMIILHNFGEPLMNSEIASMVRIIREKKAAQVVQFATNGLLLTEKAARALIESGLDTITLSVDAYTREQYRDLKGIDGLERLKENARILMKLKKLCKSPLPWVSAKMVRRKGHEDTFRPFLREWSEMVDEALLTPYSNWGGDVPYEGTDPIRKSRYACHFLWYYPAVDWKGDVYACCATVSGRAVIGNVNESTLHSIWTGEGLRDLRRAHLMGDLSSYPFCDSCTYWAESRVNLDSFLKP